MWISWYLNPSVLGSRRHSDKVFLTTPKNFVIGAFALTFKSFLQSFTLQLKMTMMMERKMQEYEKSLTSKLNWIRKAQQHFFDPFGYYLLLVKILQY